MAAKINVIIAGGGMGGVRAARQLARHPEFEVTLISARPDFAYYPQLYHAATGGAHSEAAIPLASLLGDVPVTLVHDTVTGFDPSSHHVTTASGQTYKYDELILALGSVTNYFGIAGLPDYSFDIKTIEGAERFKAHLHRQLVEERHADLNYVVVGGGPTGVELAAALGEYLQRIVRLHGIMHPRYRVDLVEAAPRLLPRLPESYAAKVQRRLEKLGVTIMTGAVVEGETAKELKLKGKTLESETVVWTAGVANNPFFKAQAAHFTLAKNGRVEVNQYLEGRAHVYVIGDNANTKFTGMAQTAINDADFVAANLVRQAHAHGRKSYRPQLPVSVIPVGEGYAALQWGPLQLFGLLGWWLRRAADLIAYHDIEPWPQAWRGWRSDRLRQDNCAICGPDSSVPA